jgi:threonyl-tRNA synthetase
MDFVLPERLDAYYVASGGEKKRPIMLHRAIIGTFERFIGILIEQYAGRFPLWLAPTQVAIATITNDSDSYSRSIYNTLIECGIRSELDISSQKINHKIRNFSNQRVPIIAIIGKEEVDNMNLSLRKLGSTETEIMNLEQLIDCVKRENTKYLA